MQAFCLPIIRGAIIILLCIIARQLTNGKNNMSKVILFNAPPYAGKDLAVSFLMNEINGDTSSSVTAHHMSFKGKLIKMAALFFNLTVDEFMVNYNAGNKETGFHKDKLLSHLTISGKMYSQRTALIHVSEKVAKPMFGEAVFGVALANDISRVEGSSIILVSDSGFDLELMPVAELVGPENVLVIQIYRDGCSYSSDSRSYLNPELHPDSFFLNITNDGTKDCFFRRVKDFTRNFYKGQ